MKGTIPLLAKTFLNMGSAHCAYMTTSTLLFFRIHSFLKPDSKVNVAAIVFGDKYILIFF